MSNLILRVRDPKKIYKKVGIPHGLEVCKAKKLVLNMSL